MNEINEVSGNGALGTATGMVIGGAVAAVGAMIAAPATAGVSIAAGAIGVVAAAAVLGGKIGSAIEDAISP